MRRIFIFLPLLTLFNLICPSCSASQAAAQPQNILRWADSTPTYAGEKIVYVETRESYPEATFRDPELYAPEFMRTFLKDSQLKGQCRVIFTESNWQGLARTKPHEALHYFETILKSGGVIFMVNFWHYSQQTSKSVHNIYNQLLETAPGQIQFFEQEISHLTENPIFSWWNNNPWKTSEIIEGRKNIFTDVVHESGQERRLGSATASQLSISNILKKISVGIYEENFPAKLHRTISFERFMSAPLPFTLVSFVKQDPIPTITFRIQTKSSHYILEPQLTPRPFDMLDPEQLEQLFNRVRKFQKEQSEKEEKAASKTTSELISVKTFEQAFAYENEKIVYLGIGTATYSGDNDPDAQSYPEFMKSLCQKSLYKEQCKLILIDGQWKSMKQEEFLKIFSQGLPPASFFIGENLKPQDHKKMQEYLETALENGSVVCIADFSCNWDDDISRFLRNMYNELLKKFPKQINFFEYEKIFGSSSMIWWQNNTWNERDSSIASERSDAVDSLLLEALNHNKKLTLKALKRELAHTYDNEFPAGLHATTTLEQFMHEKLPCEIISLTKTDLLPVLTFSIQEEGSHYILKPELSRKPLDIFDLKQLDAFYKEFLAHEKALAERYAQCVNPQVSVQAPITQEVSQTSSQSEKVSQEEGKKKSSESCVVA